MSRVNLTIVQVVVLLGLISGGLLTCFYLGYYTGKKNGLEEALEASLANAIKLPAPPSKDAEKQTLTDVYENLKQSKPVAKKEDEKKDGQKSSAPSMGGIASVTQAPIPEVFQDPKVKDESQDDLDAIRKALLGSSPTPQSKGVAIRELGKNQVTAPPAVKTTVAAISKENLASPDLKAPVDGTESIGLNSHSFDEDAAPELPIRKVPVHVTPAIPEAKVQTQATVQKTKAPAVPTSIPTPARRTFDESPDSQANSNSTILRKGWYAQVAAPPTEEDANQLARKLKSSGFATVIERAEVRDQHYFRVLVGPEQSRELGNRMLEELKRESYIKSDPFIRMVR